LPLTNLEPGLHSPARQASDLLIAPGDVRRPPDSVQWLSESHDDEWDAFVSAHPLGLVYHLSAWKRVLEDAFGHIRGQVVILRDGQNGQIAAGVPVYTVRSWLLGTRTVSVPFATFCDPLVSTAHDFLQLVPAMRSLADASGSRRLEIRSRRMADSLGQARLPVGVRYKHHYLPLDRSPEALFASFAKTPVRQRVNQARRAGVVVEERSDEEGVRICHAILVETRRRLLLPPMPCAFFQAMRRHLGSGRFGVWIARQNGQPVGALIAVRFKQLWTVEYSGNAASATPGVNQLLYWETIRRAAATGATHFSFGRTSINNTSLMTYKRRWATIEEDLVDFVPHGRVSPRPRERHQSAAYRVLKLLLDKSPTPVTELIGDFCYRHLG